MGRLTTHVLDTAVGLPLLTLIALARVGGGLAQLTGPLGRVQFEVIDVPPWCSTVLRVHNEDAAHEITKPRAKHRGAGGTGR